MTLLMPTDGAQLEAAISHMSDPITITCEGLLGYMPAYEQKEVAENIYKILSDRGGGGSHPISAVFLKTRATSQRILFLTVSPKDLWHRSPQAPMSRAEKCLWILDIGFLIEEYTYRPDVKDISALRNLDEEEKNSVYNDALNCQECSYIILKCKNT